MDAARESLYQRLTVNLEELAALYAQLLEHVVRERDLLLAADLEGLGVNNQDKELLIRKVTLADNLRLKIAEDLSVELGLDARQPRLLEIARKLGGSRGEKLKQQHAALEALLSRASEANRSNETYARSALRVVNGAMNDLKETIAGKKTYGGKGQYKIGPETTGNFVRKEA